MNTRLRLAVSGEIEVELGNDEAFGGYWNRPDADAKAIRDGWYATGDTGHLDEDGDLWIDGRVDDMIISGGENVHPLEVEDVLASHPGVEEVAVDRCPRRPVGAAGGGVVVGTATAEELDAHCLASPLARFKRPREYRIVAALPKSASGKILRRMLRDEPGGDDMTEYDGFRVERDGEVATVTLDVPEKLNRVSMAARDQLAAVFAELGHDERCVSSCSRAQAGRSRQAATSRASWSAPRGRSRSSRRTWPLPSDARSR